MSDPARDLYSFLRSKDFVSEDDASGDDSSRLRAVDDLDALDDHENHDASDDSSADGGDRSLSFSDEDLATRAVAAEEDALNQVDFGIIQVDDDGVVQFFNRYESDLSGVPRDQAVGQNFFNELAPCSNNRLFRGRFKDGVRSGRMNEQFTYTYTYKMRPTLVDVRLCRSGSNENWIFVRKK